MLRYTFREILTIPDAKNADPQVIGESLESIKDEVGGRLTPATVVNSASDKKSPLHGYFEWDDAKAANAFRLDQARVLIRSIKVETDDGEAPAYFSISEKGGRTYRSYGDVMASRDLQMIVLQAAERDLDAFNSRYQDLKDICDLIRPARRELSRRARKQPEARV